MTPKPFYLTSEFWATVLTIAGNVIFAVADKLPARYVSIASAVVVGLYALSRGIVKHSSATPPTL